MQYSNPEKSPEIKNLFSLKGKTSLIIGGAGLLGSEICYALAEQGSNIIIASRNLKNCEKIANKLQKKFKKIKVGAFSVDIADNESIENLFKNVSLKFKKLDILVNSGTSNKKNNLETINLKDWDNDINITLNGVFKTIKIFLPLLKKTNGNILNIASMYGHVAPDYRLYDSSKFANPPSYGAAKAGIIQLTKYLCSFLAENKIRVNSISPGPFPYPSTQKENPKFIDRLSKKNPMNRIGKPYELKGIVVLLCSEAGSYINGQNISVDGGWSIW